MKKLFRNKKLLAILLAMMLILGSGNVAFAALPEGNGGNPSGGGGSTGPGSTYHDPIMNEIVTTMAESINGEEAFDYVSYVYMGWRTTGGPWQNQVIEGFLMNQLEDGGYVKADKDMSSAADQDYVWLQHDESTADVWAPEYARLKVVTEVRPEFQATADRFNVESYAFDPTSKTYLDHYGEQYGVSNVDEMWDWIIEKDGSGNRTNVVNGLEAELNKRAHLTWQTGFTNPSGTDPENAKVIKAEVVNVGKVTSSGSKYASEYTGSESDLKGKVLLCTTGNSTNWNYAKQVGAVSVMSKASLSSYSNPTIDGEQWYTNSARYASGRGMAANKEQMAAGAPIVEWNLSIDQERDMLALLAAHEKIEVEVVAIGDIYPMSDDGKSAKHGDGQLMAIAEIAGSTKPDERVMFVAHVQEPSANDNATGVGLNLELALKMKEMIDTGKMERPERTITFFWGDEMSCARLWLAAHPEEQEKVVCAIDLDMVGEDPEKTGGVMRIEKTPDPSAIYNYTLDVLPGQAPYHETSTKFVRLPDSHTLWGAGKVPPMGGFFINDLYMEAAQQVIAFVDKKFQVDVCPYEGGSDHSIFLQSGVPALLTWHFTDYVYHTTVDTMNMVSAKELENVGITSLSTGYLAAIATEREASAMMDILMAAAKDRFRVETENTARHEAWTKEKGGDMETALTLEKEVLNAWGTWYKEALQSCREYLLTDVSAEYLALEAQNLEKIEQWTTEATDFAERTMGKKVLDMEASYDAKLKWVATEKGTDLTLTNVLSVKNLRNVSLIRLVLTYDADAFTIDEGDVTSLVNQFGIQYDMSPGQVGVVLTVPGGTVTREGATDVLETIFHVKEGASPEQLNVRIKKLELHGESDENITVQFPHQVLNDQAVTEIYYYEGEIDVNGDGILDWQDLSRALTYFGKTSSDDGWNGEYGFWRADLDKDGKITIIDFALLKHAIHTAEMQ